MNVKTLALSLCTAVVLMSCGNETKKATETVKKAATEVKETTKKAAAKVEETTEKAVEKVEEVVEKAVAVKAATPEQLASGKAIYGKLCVACHQANAKGIPGAFPPLEKSDYLNADVNRAITIILKGKTGEITVNGKKFNSAMTPQPLNAQEVADVLTYVYNSWDNNKTVVTKEQVEAVKAKL